MPRSIFKTFLFALCVLVTSLSKAEITEQLSHIEGLRFQELTGINPNYRIFEMYYRQPMDHQNLSGPWFEQKLILWHKSEARPMVLQTSGYSIFSVALSALASEFNANQIQVEHRYFEKSIPENANWSYLNIAQSAADFHRITLAFKNIYTAKWVNTGRSKGGMTSMYHRYFYPDDLDATVAHVAPHSYSTDDPRYAHFLAENIGGDENRVCRDKLVASQRALLSQRTEIESQVEGDFSLLGNKAIGIEHSIIEMPWSFWQYSGPNQDCSNVPAPEAPFAEHLNFLMQNNDPNGYSDASLKGFVPYYYQASTQLGSPGTFLDSLQDLLLYAPTFNINSYVPQDIRAPYDHARAMTKVSEWIKSSSERILYVYGEWDPWSGGPFEPRADGDSFRFFVPKTNHSAQFINLKGEARDLAYMKLRRWLNLEDRTPPPSSLGPRAPTLEELEFNALKKQHAKSIF